MQAKRRVWGKSLGSILAVVVMALSALAAAGFVVHSGAAARAAPSSAGSLTAAGSVRASGSSPALSSLPAGNSPHPGTIDAYEPVPNGATTTDPAVAYDTTSYEVVLNVYQTLVSFNGSSTSSFVPTLATCVPLQGTQCAQDYGAGFTGVYNTTGSPYNGSNGHPLYWTFVLDPAARFYDPGTTHSWPVYPTDVMFSVARTLAWSTYPYAARTSGWIIGQSLLPPGNAAWDGGIHDPFNNTPANVFDSMLVNDSAYCPATAMDGIHGNGCITFKADGSGQYWTEFLDFVEDNLGASVVPCGWFTYKSAGVPNWTGTHAASGDGPCKLPDGGTTTNATAWSTFVAAQGLKGWDTFIKLDSNYPAPQPNVQWSMVGSGPYYAVVNPHLSYALAPNTAYSQPSGCSGAAGLATYTGYCDPAPGHYIPRIDVTWETAQEGDSLGTDAIEAGTADFAGIYTTQTSTLLGFVHSGIWQYLLFPTISDAFVPINLGISYSAYNTSFAGAPLHANPINAQLFTDIGLRNFYIDAYPYATIQSTINTVDGIQFSFEAGGPIPFGMGNYYPTNVSWPYLNGDPTQSSSVVGSAAWWWSQVTNASSPYYNATIVTKCTPSSPCTWPIGYFDGAPANLPLIDDWAGEVYNLSGHRLQPWPLALSFTQFLTDTLIGPYQSPLASIVGFGWAPDYPDPTDYVAPITQPSNAYTAPDTFANQLSLPAFEQNATCGHNGTATTAAAYANLTYWAVKAMNPATGAINDACEGVAYNVASYWMLAAGALSPSPTRVLDYNLIEQITNALGMYVWNGQSNALVGFAPWINPATVNENPVIGGGGDIVWFQIHYSSSYSVTVHESGLPSGTSWSASLGASTQTSTTTSIVFANIPNGTLGYSVSFVPHYSVTPSSGTITVNGASASQSVTYAHFGGATTNLMFNESGLASNTSWSVVVPGYGAVAGGNPSLAIALPQSATYNYTPQPVVGYTPPGPGNATVATSPVSVPLNYSSFTGTVYQLNFDEAGLPSGTNWSVSIGGAGAGYAGSSTSRAISFAVKNGSVPFTIGTAPGFAATQTFGTVTVSGATVTIEVFFQPTYKVTFTSSGLPSGTSWSVYFAGSSHTAIAPAPISFNVTNSSWTFAASASGYTATPGGGSIPVSGSNAAQTIGFVKATSAAKPSWESLSELAYILIGLLVLTTVIGFAMAARYAGRSKPATPPESWSGEPAPGEESSSPPPTPPPPST